MIGLIKTLGFNIDDCSLFDPFFRINNSAFKPYFSKSNSNVAGRLPSFKYLFYTNLSFVSLGIDSGLTGI